MKVVIACGGTGGHLFPGIAVAQALCRRGAQIKLLVSRKEIDREAAQAGPSIEIETIPAVGAPGGVSTRWISFGFQLAASLCHCVCVFRNFRPDIVLGMGGFASAPPILAARILGVPSVIHESNAVPGKANRWVSRWVDAVAVGMEECAQFFPADKTVVTGTPVRAGLHQVAATEARLRLGLQPDRLTVLVMGGSQGAHGINEAVVTMLTAMNGLQERLQFIHLCGKEDEEWLKSEFKKVNCPAKVNGFLREMELAYSAADLIVSRSGASSLAETAHYGLPSILIPYPFAADQHQLRNAEVFARAGAAKIVLQDKLVSQTLLSALRQMVENKQARTTMGDAARALATENAAENLVELLLKTATAHKKAVDAPRATACTHNKEVANSR